uniref:hypothetical protein n=1 Tax=Streptomyces blattellae TaxID=2569855 RepID=UPI0012B83D41|nr:hypothetical protein [Streptomyces blattellae]
MLGQLKSVYFQVTDPLNLEVDLLFSDTASTCFETGEADEPAPRDADGRLLPEGSDPQLAAHHRRFRAHGKSKAPATICPRSSSA